MARENFETEQDDFRDFVDKWEKAQEQGIFNQASGPATPTPQTSDPSFFGPVDTNPSDDINTIDSTYWNAIYAASDNSGDAPDPLEAIQVLTEAEKSNNKKSVNKNKKSNKTKKKSNSKKKDHKECPPNPVGDDTYGTDQELEDKSVGATFDEEDIKELEDMKLRLHELKGKMAGALAEGKKFKKIGSQIKSLENKINELSTAMGYSLE